MIKREATLYATKKIFRDLGLMTVIIAGSLLCTLPFLWLTSFIDDITSLALPAILVADFVAAWFIYGIFSDYYEDYHIGHEKDGVRR